MAWNKTGNLKGPQGDQGIQGERGLQGPEGIQGIEGPPGPSWPRVVKTADQASTSAVFANVADLAFAVQPNTTYLFRFVLFYTTAAAATALQASVTTPAAPTLLRFFQRTHTGPTAIHMGVQSAADANLNPATGGGATPLVAEVEGVIRTGGSGGNVQLRFRSEVAGSAVTVLAGSFGTYG